MKSIPSLRSHPLFQRVRGENPTESEPKGSLASGSERNRSSSRAPIGVKGLESGVEMALFGAWIAGEMALFGAWAAWEMALFEKEKKEKGKGKRKRKKEK